MCIKYIQTMILLSVMVELNSAEDVTVAVLLTEIAWVSLFMNIRFLLQNETACLIKPFDRASI